MMQFDSQCPVCGETSFNEYSVLWPELIDTWGLTLEEISYINRQQGFHCTGCGNNLRSMGLAAAITKEIQFDGNLSAFGTSGSDISLLEINHAGGLTPYLCNLNRHRLIEYPEYDMQHLQIESNSFDIVIHSDTLEHVPNAVAALAECKRVLKENGKCIFTVPITVDRTTRSRNGLPASYHGQSGVLANDQVVHTEFGMDVWKTIIQAGFQNCKIFSYEYPAAIVIIAD